MWNTQRLIINCCMLLLECRAPGAEHGSSHGRRGSPEIRRGPGQIERPRVMNATFGGGEALIFKRANVTFHMYSVKCTPLVLINHPFPPLPHPPLSLSLLSTVSIVSAMTAWLRFSGEIYGHLSHCIYRGDSRRRGACRAARALRLTPLCYVL